MADVQLDERLARAALVPGARAKKKSARPEPPATGVSPYPYEENGVPAGGASWAGRARAASGGDEEQAEHPGCAGPPPSGRPPQGDHGDVVVPMGRPGRRHQALDHGLGRAPADARPRGGVDCGLVGVEVEDAVAEHHEGVARRQRNMPSSRWSRRRRRPARPGPEASPSCRRPARSGPGRARRRRRYVAALGVEPGVEQGGEHAAGEVRLHGGGGQARRRRRGRPGGCPPAGRPEGWP